MGWFWLGPSWKPAHTVKPACLWKRSGQPSLGTSSTRPDPARGFGRVGRPGRAGGLAGISRVGPFLSIPGGFLVLPSEV